MANGTAWGLGAAAVLGIYADLAMNIASATNSSPQTTELFAGQRSETLWKWVVIGGGASLAFGLAGSIIAGSALPFIATAVVVAVMGVMYSFALKWGQESA
jgi:hypothetical protein